MADRKEILRGWLWLIALIVCLPIGACNCNNSADGAADKDSAEKAKSEAPKGDKGEGDEDEGTAEAIPEDLYQDFNLKVFEQKDRRRIVKIFKAELCPCPESNASLHECLKTRETRCGLAEQAAATTAQMVHAAYSETDILDKVAELIENSKKSFEFVLDDRPHKGNVDAPVKIVEFADFQCPHCKEAAKIVDELHEKYPDKIVVYYKTYPLSSGGPVSQLAAQSAIAAHRQGKFWKMHDLLYENQRSLTPESFRKLARQIGLNMKKFEADVQSAEVAAHVAKDRNEGDESGLSGTPTFYINGRRYLEEPSVERMSAAIEAALGGDTTTKTN